MKKQLIGNTPMIQIDYQYHGKQRRVYAKLEYFNVTGSIKDRIAFAILEKAKEENQLEPGMPIVEATSGNTGISLSALGALLKHKVVIFMPDWVSVERRKLLNLYGAEVHLFSKEEGGFSRCIEEAKQYAKEHHGFLANQFENPANVEAQEKTGEEILEKIEPTGFVSGIGTGGTLMGITRAFQKQKKEVHIWALEPENMSLLKTGKVSSHKIDGIGDEFIPAIVDPTKIENIVLISDEEAQAMTRMLSQDLGLGVGISSGANLLAAIRMEEQLGGKIVTVFPDDNKKYIDSHIESVKKMSEIVLIHYEVI